MTKRYIDIRFTFTEEYDAHEDWIDLELKHVKAVRTDLSEGERMTLGERVAQSDFWQVDVWNAIQTALYRDGKVTP